LSTSRFRSSIVLFGATAFLQFAIDVSACALAYSQEVDAWHRASTLEESLVPEAMHEALEEFTRWDNASRSGKGYSESADLGILASSETPYWLVNYLRLFELTKDRAWLEKCNDHLKRMMSFLTADGQGYRGWRTPRYGVSLVNIGERLGAQHIAITPSAARIPWVAGGDKVTGDLYSLSFSSERVLIISNITRGAVLSKLQYVDGLTIDQIPGAKLKLGGAFEPGSVIVKTTRAHPLRYAYDDGCIARAMALWLKLVLGNHELAARYSNETEAYSRFLEHDVFDYWENWWLPAEGTYTFTADETEEFPKAVLPHNQYLSLGRAWLALSTLPNLSDPERFSNKARRIAEYFRQHLHQKGDRWTWNYWDPRSSDPHVWIRADDLSHAAVCAAFVAEAAELGVVFTLPDVEGMAHTFLGAVLGASSPKPEFTLRVSGEGAGSASVVYDWLFLSKLEARIAQIGWRRFVADGRPASRIPAMLLAAKEAQAH
jgi:hypothetical protein